MSSKNSHATHGSNNQQKLELLPRCARNFGSFFPVPASWLLTPRHLRQNLRKSRLFGGTSEFFATRAAHLLGGRSFCWFGQQTLLGVFQSQPKFFKPDAPRFVQETAA